MSSRADASQGRYHASALQTFAAGLMTRIGLASERAAVVAEILLEGDLLGHTTHGLQLLPHYLAALEKGTMAAAGEPEIVADHGAAMVWDGRYLPGPWLVARGIDTLIARAAAHKVAALVIRRASHIGCLAAYPKRATDRGLMMLLTCSDPSIVSVAPFGSASRRYTPNPIAAGWPTNGDPVILDVGMSTTSNGLVSRLRQRGGKLPGKWLIDAAGNASDDPAAMFADPPGAMLPLGGEYLGYKGFALGLLVETLTAALGGHGRADGVKEWGASVFLQIIDPAAFGGGERFLRETSWLAEACRTAPVPPGKPPVRLPGERGLALRARQLREGVALHPDIMPVLRPWAEKLGVPVPKAA
jgi:L-lactate dehydrogenase